MATYKLQDIKEAADAKYGYVEIDMPDDKPVRLTPYLRLPKEQRQALDAANKKNADESVEYDVADFLRDALYAVAASEGDADRLYEAVGDDPAALSLIFEHYSGDTQTGEAPPSQG